VSEGSGWQRIAGDFLRLLTFRLKRPALLALSNRHLGAALACTWIVGMGRWWDDPGASFLQKLGVGSVVYVFVLAALLWLVILPLKPEDWAYRRVLTFVAMTSPPAILYAIPVERFFSLSTAGTLNLWFLAVVATWRVALLVQFLLVLPRVGWIKSLIAALLPLASIVTALTVLNLHRVVFSIMGGIAEQDRSSHDAAYEVLLLLTALSMLAAPVLLVGYLVAIVHCRLKRA
jgi:hypothetical protein